MCGVGLYCHDVVTYDNTRYVNWSGRGPLHCAVVKPLHLPTAIIAPVSDPFFGPMQEPAFGISLHGAVGGESISLGTLRAIVDNADAIREWLEQPREVVAPVRVPPRKGKADPRTLRPIGERVSRCPSCNAVKVARLSGKVMCAACGWTVGEG